MSGGGPGAVGATGAPRTAHATGAARTAHATGAARTAHATGAARTAHATGAAGSVEQRVRGVLRDAGAVGWLHARQLPGAGGETEASAREISVGADDLVVTASVYKVPLLVAMCREIDAGTLDPCETVRVDPASATHGTTGLSVFTDPVSLSWRDLAASMITVSDNAAADVLLHRIGMDAVRDVLTELGLPTTYVAGSTADVQRLLMRDMGAATVKDAFAMLADNDEARRVSAYDPILVSATTPREMTRLLGLIWTDEAASAEQCAFMRRLMGAQIWPHRVSTGFPFPRVRVSGKTGSMGAVRNEIAVVEFEGEAPVAVAVFTLAARADERLPRVDTAIGECARIAVTDLRSGRLAER